MDCFGDRYQIVVKPADKAVSPSDQTSTDRLNRIKINRLINSRLYHLSIIYIDFHDPPEQVETGLSEQIHSTKADENQVLDGLMGNNHRYWDTTVAQKLERIERHKLARHALLCRVI